jgi:WD40 repeat protein
MRILDTVDGSLSAPFESSKHPQARLGVSPDGRYVAAGADDAGSIRIWDVATGAVVAELTGHRGAVNSVEFTPDGLGLVSGSDDGTVRLWQLRT